MPGDVARVVARPSPLTIRDRIEIDARLGDSIETIVRSVGFGDDLDVRVVLGDALVPRDQWATRTLDDPRHVMVITRTPGAAAIPIIIAVSAFLAEATAALLPTALAVGIKAGAAGAFGVGALGVVAGNLGVFVGGLAATYAVGSLANLAVSALVKPQSGGNLGGGGSLASSPTIQGTQNRAYPYAPVWRVYGEHWVTFPLAAKPFTEIVGGDVYLRMLLTAGYGPLVFHEFKIGDTALTDFDEIELQVFDGETTWQMDPGQPVVELPGGMTLFKEDVVQEGPGISFDVPAPYNGAIEPSLWVARTTAPNTEEISLDITFPGGLYFVDGHGRYYDISVRFQVEIKPSSSPDSAYVPATFATVGIHGLRATTPRTVNSVVIPAAGCIVFTAMRVDGFTTGFSIRAGITGSDTIRIRRVITNREGVTGTRAASAIWSVFRSIRSLDYSTLPNVTLLALRIKASDQIQGTVTEFRGRVASKLRPFLGVGEPGADADGWGAYAESRNPALAYMHALCGPEAQKAMQPARVDTDRIMAWAAVCEPTPGDYVYAFDHVIDYASTLFQVLQLIAGNARGSYTTRDGLHSVVIDVAKPSAVQEFTPRNSWDYKGRRRFIDLPHALRVNFPNAEAENQTDEIIVYDDGYSAANATEFETLEAVGTTGTDQAWRHGRYLQKVARHRQELHEVTVDVEYLVAERGDRVLLSHDVPFANARVGRITALEASGGLRRWLEMDEEVLYEEGNFYGIVIRWLKGDEIVFTTIGTPYAGIFGATSGLTRRMLFSPAQPDDADHAWQIGDLVTFGESGQFTLDALVHTITPGPDLSATLLLTPYAGGEIFAGETPPAFESAISAPLKPAPPTPLIVSVATVGTEVVISFSLPSPTAGRAPIQRLQAQHRTATQPVGPWIDAPSISPAATRVSIPLAFSTYYDLRIRSIGGPGVASGWSTQSAFLHLSATYVANDFEILGFEVKGRGDDGQWTGRDLELSWRLGVHEFNGATAPVLRGYRVTVSNLDGRVRRDEVVTDPRYNYSLARNAEDSLRLSSGLDAFASRSVSVRIVAVDGDGDESEPFLRTLQNLAPEVPRVIAFPATLGILLNWTGAPDADATKLLVFRGPTSGLEANAATLIYSGTENPAFVDTSQSTDEWYRFARADEFSENPGQLNVTPAEQILPGTLIVIDNVVPGSITELPHQSITGPITYAPGSWATTPAFPLPSIYSLSLFQLYSVIIPAGVQARITYTLTARVSDASPALADVVQRYRVGIVATTLSGPGSTYDPALSPYLSETLMPIVVTSDIPARANVTYHNAFIYPATPPLVDTTYRFSMPMRAGGVLMGTADRHIVVTGVYADFMLLKR